MSMVVVGKEREESHVCHSYKSRKRATCVTHTRPGSESRVSLIQCVLV